MPMKLLITGGTGNLGSHLVRKAYESSKWDEVSATCHTLKPNFHKITWFSIDGRENPELLLQRTKPTHIIHTIAMSSPDVCEVNKLEAWRINVDLTKEIAAYAEASGARLLFTSSDLIFDGRTGNYDEEALPAPMNFYGDTKVEAEDAVRETMASGDFLNVRLSLLYGINMNGRTGFLDHVAGRLKARQEVFLFTDQIRSMMEVSNAADVLLSLAHHSVRGTLHVGGPAGVSRFEFGRMLARKLGVDENLVKPERMKDNPQKVRRPADVSMSIAKLGATLHAPLHTLVLDIDHGLEQVVRTFQKP